MSAQLVRFEPNPGGIDAIRSLPGMAKAVENVAKDIARDASADSSRRLARTYKATRAEETPEGVQAIAHSTYPFAHLVEFGSVNNPPLRTLTRAAMKYGEWKGDDA